MYVQLQYGNIQDEEGKLRHYYMKYCKEVTSLEFSLVWLLWLILSRDSEGTKRVPTWCATVLLEKNAAVTPVRELPDKAK